MARSRFCYAMGYAATAAEQEEGLANNKKNKKEDDDVVLRLPDDVVELFLRAAAEEEEDAWAARLARCYPGLRVQAMELVVGGLQGRACVDRLLQLRLSERMGGARADELEAEGYLDAYIDASGGVLHLLDRRPLRMAPMLVERLREERRETVAELSGLRERHDQLEVLIAHLQFVLQNVRIVLPLSSHHNNHNNMEEDAETRVLREMMLLLPDFIAIINHNEQQLRRFEGEELLLVQEIYDLHGRSEEITGVLVHQDSLAAAAAAAAEAATKKKSAPRPQSPSSKKQKILEP